MKKLIFAALATLLLLASCKSEEKIVYFQDVQSGDVFSTQAIQTLKLQSGEKLSIVVTSAATPTLATQFNLPLQTLQAAGSNSTSNQITPYIIDENGCIDVPIIGRISIAGLTRSEAAAKIQTMLRDGHLRDAVVTIQHYDQYVTVLGEVKSPGRVSITRENITLLEALGAVGDLTIQGRRDQVTVIRQEGGETKTYVVDLRSKSVFDSPVYNLKQNDVVYVAPNRKRAAESTNNENSVNSLTTWLSVSSVLISLGILIFH